MHQAPRTMPANERRRSSGRRAGVSLGAAGGMGCALDVQTARYLPLEIPGYAPGAGWRAAYLATLLEDPAPLKVGQSDSSVEGLIGRAQSAPKRSKTRAWREATIG